MDAYEEVLFHCCSKEAVDIYTNLNEDGKSKMLEAIRDCVLSHNNMPVFNQLENVSLKEESWIYEKEIAILRKAIETSGSTVYLKCFSNLLTIFRHYGEIKFRAVSLINHCREFNESLSRYRNENQVSVNFNISSDVIIKNENSLIDSMKLQKIFIKDLKLFATAKGKYLEGQLITNPIPYVGIITYLDDDNGDYVKLDLYNMISLGRNKWELAEKKFNKGAKLKILEPFYKIFKDGERGIRVDSPNEIVIEENSNVDFTLMREQGKEFFKQGEFLCALELYLDGLAKFEDTAGVILNNRAQTELILGENEEALLDSAAALMFGDNEKAKKRYKTAIEKCGLIADDISSIKLIWQKALTKLQNRGLGNLESTNEEANTLYRGGKFKEARVHYTAALSYPDVCLLLNNIATVCMKLKILQTAIASASACLRLAKDQRAIGKARYTMTKSFWMLGAFNLAKLSAKDDLSLEKFWRNVDSPEAQAKLIFEERVFRNIVCGQTLDDYLKTAATKEIPGDFVNTEVLEYAYIKNKGPGFRAISDIAAGEVLVLDHPFALSSFEAEAKEDDEFSITAFMNLTNNSSMVKSQLELAKRILHLIKFDGILAKKLMLLQVLQKISHDEKLPTVDLKWMAHQNLSFEILPFLPQHPRTVGCDIKKLTSSHVRDLIKVNGFECGGTSKHKIEKRIALYLRLSLFNHDDKYNCYHVLVGDSTAVISNRDIKKYEELTIQCINVKDICPIPKEGSCGF